MSEDEQRRFIELWLRRHAEQAKAGHDVAKGPKPQAQGRETVEAEPVVEVEAAEPATLTDEELEPELPEDVSALVEDEEAEATEPPTLTDEELAEVEPVELEVEATEPLTLTDEELAEVERLRSGTARLSSRVPASGEAIELSIREADSTLQVVTTQQAVKAGDDYASRLLKYIPTETVAAYLALSGVVASADGNRAAMLWAVFVFGLLLTPLYLRRVGNVHSWLQLGISTAAFVVWVFALGGPWALLSWYEPYQGTLLLIAFTTTAPLVIPVPPSLKSAPAAG